VCDGVGNNARSPYEGVRNPCEFIIKLLLESIDNAPAIFNDNVLNDVVPDGAVFNNGNAASNLSSFKLKARTKPEPETTPFTTARDDCKPE